MSVLLGEMHNDMYTVVFFFNDTATTEIYTLSLHDALPIFQTYLIRSLLSEGRIRYETLVKTSEGVKPRLIEREGPRSEEHTSELQSRQYLVCRLLLEKKK